MYLLYIVDKLSIDKGIQTDIYIYQGNRGPPLNLLNSLNLGGKMTFINNNNNTLAG